LKPPPIWSSTLNFSLFCDSFPPQACPRSCSPLCSPPLSSSNCGFSSSKAFPAPCWRSQRTTFARGKLLGFYQHLSPPPSFFDSSHLPIVPPGRFTPRASSGVHQPFPNAPMPAFSSSSNRVLLTVFVSMHFPGRHIRDLLDRACIAGKNVRTFTLFYSP